MATTGETTITTVVAVARFLQHEAARLRAAAQDDSAESLDVAIDCLASVYGTRTVTAAETTDIDLATVLADYGGHVVLPASPAAAAVTDVAQQQQAEALKEEGNRLLKASMFDEALSKYSEAIALHPSAAVYCNRAAASTRVGEYADAIKDCRSALAIDPTYHKAHARIGVVQKRMGLLEDALMAYQKALDLAPDNESYAAAVADLQATIDQESAQQPQQPAGLDLGALLGGLAAPPSSSSTARSSTDTDGSSGSSGSTGGGGPPGELNFGALLSNPAVMGMMSSPAVQGLLGNLMGGQAQAPAAGSEARGVSGAAPQQAQPNPLGSLLNMAQSFAQNVETSNPDAARQFREQFGGQDQGTEGGDDGQQ
eukprot:m.355392 g.355392  ORF g.355392 m.355392 type:complete len:369 (-) comp19923_c0_seq4:117-1223(-)